MEVSHHEGLEVRRRIWRNQETPVKSLPVFLGKASSCPSAVTKGFIISGSLLKTSSRADLATSVAQMLLTRCPVVSIGSKRRTGQVHDAWQGFSKRPLGPRFSTPRPTHYALPSSPFGVAVGIRRCPREVEDGMVKAPTVPIPARLPHADHAVRRRAPKEVTSGEETPWRLGWRRRLGGGEGVGLF